MSYQRKAHHWLGTIIVVIVILIIRKYLQFQFKTHFKLISIKYCFILSQCLNVEKERSEFQAWKVESGWWAAPSMAAPVPPVACRVLQSMKFFFYRPKRNIFRRDRCRQADNLLENFSPILFYPLILLPNIKNWSKGQLSRIFQKAI